MKLLELRQKNKLNQETVAKALGISQEKYSRLENQVSKIDSDILIKLADYYNVSLDYLCDRQYNNNVGYIPDEKKNSVQKLLSLNETEFIRADSYLDALIDNIKK